MSPRHNRSRGGEKPEQQQGDHDDRYGGVQRTETWQGEEWYVRLVAGASAPGKRYRCPGCDQEIPGGAPHVVAWPEYGEWTTGATGTRPAGTRRTAAPAGCSGPATRRSTEPGVLSPAY